MPYKNSDDKKRWNALHNPNRVASRQSGKRISLNKIKHRTYVCELCGSVGKTEFHEYNRNPINVIEVCCNGYESCHYKIHNNLFDESVIFLQCI
jgi:hypothetical protein